MTEDNTPANRPSHTAYTVREYPKGGERKSDWTPIGVAWAHRDGNGFDIVLEALPINGRIAIRTNKPKAAPSEQA